jgi:hypothetical protein
MLRTDLAPALTTAQCCKFSTLGRREKGEHGLGRCDVAWERCTSSVLNSLKQFNISQRAV